MIFDNDLIQSIRELVKAEGYIDEISIKNWAQYRLLSFKPLERERPTINQDGSFIPAVDSMFNLGH
ncbi:hypothetical protein [Bacillus sp. FJAT-45037]|uniref:hypothetical protein n=1 Tax=Bacillus sp. FJAT-45037 TaxID=2011007 RepID=UPI000C235EA6|nr:hypothetical protein [Bacillus sp. FJAT-45037]